MRPMILYSLVSLLINSIKGLSYSNESVEGRIDKNLKILSFFFHDFTYHSCLKQLLFVVLSLNIFI